MLSIWGYAVVAAVIAVLASLIGQLIPGVGIVFVALTSTMWTAYSADRARRTQGRC